MIPLILYTLLFLVLGICWCLIPRQPATRLRLKVNNAMSFTPGSTKFLVVSPNGALDANPNVIVAVDNPAIVAVTPVDGNPLEYKLDFLAEGPFTLNASAFSSDGTTITGTLSDVVSPIPATLLNLSIQDTA